MNTLLLAYPLRPDSLVDEARQLFKTVHYWPQKPGNDYSGQAAPLPPAEAYAEADAMVVFHLPSNLKHISQTPNLKLVQLVGAGYDQIINTDFWRSIDPEHPITLSNATGIHVRSIGEHVIMYILALTHKLQISQLQNQQRQQWPGFKTFCTPRDPGGLFIREMAEMTIGVLGYGHLGRECARLASAFGSKIIACSREGAPKTVKGYLIPGTGEPEAKLPQAWFKTDPTSLRDFCSKADVVINCLPLTDQTTKIIGREELCAMRNEGILINVGRGGTVDQVALIEALNAPYTDEPGALTIGGAGLDVTDPEPLPQGHELFMMENVILTGHTSFAARSLFSKAWDILAINKKRMEDGLGAINAVRGKGEE